jgi:NADPH2 dehydrogenase
MRTTNDAYPTLFSPIEIMGRRLVNRLTMAPLYTGYATSDGRPTPLLLEHYATMGASGLAMVVVESAAVHPSGVGSPRMLRAYGDSCVGDLSLIAEAVHRGGALACCQINHAGRFAFIDEPLSASAVPVFGRVPRELSVAEIGSLIEAYAGAAVNAVKAGFEMVELHGGTGYLLAQFISPRTNRRTDEYGGSLEGRMRFPLRVLEAVRDAVGPGVPVGYRFLADEWLPDGLGPAEAVVLAKALERCGVAYLSVTAGTYESFFLPEVLERSARPAYMAELAAGIKKAVSVPVISAGRIATPGLAERILAASQADVIGLARVIVADPDWVRKTLEGRESDIVHCQPGCDACMSQVMQGRSVICAAWPAEKKALAKERARALP